MKAEIAMSTVMANVTLSVKVTGVRANHVRVWVGLRLLRLAALVMGCGIRLD